MKKNINFNKCNKNIILKDMDITTKQKLLFANNDYIHLHKVNTITLCGNSTISVYAMNLIKECGIQLIVEYKSKPIILSNIDKSSKLKRQQLKLIIKYEDVIIKRIQSIRVYNTKQANLPKIPKQTNSEIKKMLIEANYMKKLYKKLQTINNLNYKNKAEIGKNTALHVWWIYLYAKIESCLTRMGLEKDIGVIHQCSNGLIYDIADALKPLFLKKAFIYQPHDVKQFFILWKQYKLQKLLPIMILWIFQNNKNQQCSWQHSHLFRDWNHKMNKSNL